MANFRRFLKKTASPTSCTVNSHEVLLSISNTEMTSTTPSTYAHPYLFLPIYSIVFLITIHIPIPLTPLIQAYSGVQASPRCPSSSGREYRTPSHCFVSTPSKSIESSHPDTRSDEYVRACAVCRVLQQTPRQRHQHPGLI